MTHEVSTLDVRQRLGDLLNRVALRHDEYVIARKGQPLAALVPVQKLEQMRRIARRHGLAFLEEQEGGKLSPAAAMSLAIEAQNWARVSKKKRRRK